MYDVSWCLKWFKVNRSLAEVEIREFIAFLIWTSIVDSIPLCLQINKSDKSFLEAIDMALSCILQMTELFYPKIRERLFPWVWWSVAFMLYFCSEGQSSSWIDFYSLSQFSVSLGFIYAKYRPHWIVSFLSHWQFLFDLTACFMAWAVLRMCWMSEL